MDLIASSGSFFVVAGKCQLAIFEANTSRTKYALKHMQQIPHDDTVLCFDFKHFPAEDDDRIILCTCTEKKRLLLWKYSGNFSVPEIDSPTDLPLDKRATIVQLRDDGNNHFLILGDRGGAVYEMSVDEPQKLKLLLGHLSIILGLDLSPDGRNIATADRDERIRISCYPKTHNIQAFCMGHTEYVRSVKFLQWNDTCLLASTSGDCSLKFWNYTSGLCILTVHLDEIASLENVEPSGLVFLKTKAQGFVMFVSFVAMDFVMVCWIEAKGLEMKYKHGQKYEVGSRIVGITTLEEPINAVLIASDKCGELQFFEITAEICDGLVKLDRTMVNITLSKDFESSVIQFSNMDNLPLRRAGNFGNVDQYFERKQERQSAKKIRLD